MDGVQCFSMLLCGEFGDLYYLIFIQLILIIKKNVTIYCVVAKSIFKTKFRLNSCQFWPKIFNTSITIKPGTLFLFLEVWGSRKTFFLRRPKTEIKNRPFLRRLSPKTFQKRQKIGVGKHSFLRRPKTSEKRPKTEIKNCLFFTFFTQRRPKNVQKME